MHHIRSERTPLLTPRIHQSKATVTLFSLVAASACGVLSEGFRNPPAGGFGLGRAGGRFAQIDDASAVVHNPANLVDLESAEAQLAPNWVYASVEYSPASGAPVERSQNPWKFLPNVFGSFPIEKGRWAAGIGLTTPYGVSSEWNPQGDLHYKTAHLAELMTLDASPVVSYRINDHLQIGAGVDIYWSQVRFKQFYPWAALTRNPADPEGLTEFKADGTGIGAHAGITWNVTESQRLALTYRSAARVGAEGDFKISNLPAVASALGFSDRSDFATQVDFPNILGLGYGIRVTPQFRLEADVEWVEFSRLSAFPLNIGANNALLPSAELRQDWKNTFTAGFGGDYAFADNWSLRGGYQYYESPVPDATLSPVIPDSNQHVITTGIAYRFGHHRLEFSYAKVFYLDMTLSPALSPAFAGNYTFDVHLFSAGYSFSF